MIERRKLWLCIGFVVSISPVTLGQSRGSVDAYREMRRSQMRVQDAVGEGSLVCTRDDRNCEIALIQFELVGEAAERASIHRGVEKPRVQITHGRVRVTVGSSQMRDDFVEQIGHRTKEAREHLRSHALRDFDVDLNETGGIQNGLHGRFVSKGPVSKLPTFSVVQVLDDSNMICKLGKTLCWIVGVSTEGITDNQNITFDMDLKVEGNKTYQTALGTNTAWLLRKEPIKGREKALSAWERRRERLWTSDDGKYQTRASFIRLDSGNALLRKSDGSETSVPLTRISDLDKEFIQHLVREQKEVHEDALDALIPAMKRSFFGLIQD